MLVTMWRGDVCVRGLCLYGCGWFPCFLNLVGCLYGVGDLPLFLLWELSYCFLSPLSSVSVTGVTCGVDECVMKSVFLLLLLGGFAVVDGDDTETKQCTR